MYDSPVLEHVMAWTDQVLLRWVVLLLHGSDTDADARNLEGAIAKGQASLPSPTTPSSLSFSHESSITAGVHHGGVRVRGVASPNSGGTGVEDAAYGWAQRLGLAVHEAFCSARIAELFDIIADYPDSAVAIGELKVRRTGDKS